MDKPSRAVSRHPGDKRDHGGPGVGSTGETETEIVFNIYILYIVRKQLLATQFMSSFYTLVLFKQNQTDISLLYVSKV